MNETFAEIENAIKTFPNQFSWQPQIINSDKLPQSAKNIAICGLGGSALAANLLLSAPQTANLRIHRDYWHEWLGQMDLLILSSYSGNTEEVLDCLDQALKNNIPVAIAAHDGELVERAKEHNLAHIILPAAAQPRYAIGYSYIALSALVSEPLSIQTGKDLSNICANSVTMSDIVSEIAGKQIVLYSTAQNFAITYVWKILINETAKQMAWANKLPEFNHNELQGYLTANKFNLDDNLAVVFITTNDEHPRNRRRIDIVSKQIKEKGIDVTEVLIEGDSVLEQAVYGWQAGMYFSLELARLNQVDPKNVEIIEDLKEQLKN